MTELPENTRTSTDTNQSETAFLNHWAAKKAKMISECYVACEVVSYRGSINSCYIQQAIEFPKTVNSIL